MGTALEANGELNAALDSFREAIRLQPDLAAAHNNLGTVLKSLGRSREAIASFEEAVRLNGDLAEAHVGLGGALHLAKRMDEAVAAYDRALQLQGDPGRAAGEVQPATIHPDLASVRNNRAIALLLLGDFAAGWPEYEWRWHLKDAPRRTWSQPAWDGSPLDGRRILLHAEQGYGDALQFIRYAPLVRERGGHVIVCCRRSLIPILSTCAGIDEFRAKKNRSATSTSTLG